VARVTERPAYRLPRDILPEHYSLVLEPDFGRAAFDGEASIEVRVVVPTSEVVLNAAELDISEARLVPDAGPDVAARVSYRPEEEQVALVLDQELQPGHWRLELRFSGQLNDLLHGFYRSKFRGDSGDEWIAVTQFESTDARRAFPCWDEPDLKATFGITLVSDDKLTVLSNAAEVSSELIDNGKRRTRFADTIKMSTYLVAVVMGPFELTAPRDVGGVPVRIASVPGRAALTGLAQDAAAHSLSFLSEYFSMPYPGDKLDHIAIPDFAAGAMENLGLVTYRETALLVSPESSQVERQRVVATIGHETAHMWFGDLVTMRWWEGIWLNEAFASFMELLSTDAFEPRWQVWTNFGVDRAAALATDSLHATRAIEFPVGRPEEAEDMFDVITYDKGCSVLRMIERYLGDETFRYGLRLYLDRHQYGNTDTVDLWGALEDASGQPVRATMSTWVNQPGHPLVSAELTGPSELQLSQRRFLLDGKEGGAEADQRWAVPVTLRYATTDGAVVREQLLLEDQSTQVILKGSPSWLLVNESAWGVYRVGYSDDLRGRLLGALGQLDERERLSLVSDTWAAAVAGLVPLGAPLELWSALRDERDPDVWWTISGGLGLLDLVSDEKVRPMLQGLTRALAGPLLDDVGWGPGDGSQETPRLARLRARLVTLLGTVGADDNVQAEARRRLAEADGGGSPLPPDLATAVAQVAATAGGEREWDTLYARYKRATTPQDEVRYLYALGAFSSPGLLWRALELAFSDEVRSQDAPYLVMSVLGRREGSESAWEAIETHWDEMQARWPSNSTHRMLEALPALAAAGEAVAQRALHWLDDHPMARGELRLRQSRERLLINLAFKQRVVHLLPNVLAAGSPPGAR
jgi:puromycin-sensitive aminopeptidase